MDKGDRKEEIEEWSKGRKRRDGEKTQNESGQPHIPSHTSVKST